VTVPPFHPSWRTRTLSALARRFGVAFVVPTIASLEQVDSHKYGSQPGSATLAKDERSHAFLLRTLTEQSAGGLEGGVVARIEGRHRAGSGNALRAAVLGANDGLVSNLSLIMGVAGAALSSQAILVTGLAGLLAGAFSMALGEWLSVQSSRELYQRQIAIEAAEISSNPGEEAEELALIYQAKGLSDEQARTTAARILGDREQAISTLAREELGINPEELGGSAWEAAITSFLLFAMGAAVPVLPFLFLSGLPAVITSLLLGTLGLFAIGAGITLFTGRSVWFSGLRQVAFGLAAAAITYFIGNLIGVSIAG
jgi:VIT1/CCC1 family predicted Fe2+/Mn2+ transporter